VEVNDKGCIRYDTTFVTIVYDTVTFYNFIDTAICLHAPPVTRSASLNPIVNYQWTPTTGIPISNSAVAAISPDTSAEYYLTVSYPGCPNIVDSFHIDVQPDPSIFMGGNRDVCYGDTIHIDAVVSPAWYTHYSYSWAPGTGLDNTNLSNVVFTSTAGPNDTATLKYIVTVTTPAWRVGLTQGCISQDSGFIFVHPVKYDTALLPVNLCPGDSIQLIPTLNTHGQNMAVVLSAFRWTPGLYLDDSISSMPWVHPITSQDYRLVTYSQFGCRDTLDVSITVHPAAVLDLGDSATIYPGDSYQINPQTNCIYFQWYPPLGLSNVNLSNPVANPDVNTTYYVQATTESGCKINDSFRVHVDPTSTVAIPNAFSPGASVNSRFYVIRQGIVSLNYFHIFDRWGNMVYDSKNIDDGWDGTYKGKPQPFGVYVYEFEAVNVNGAVFKRHGNVTLIR
jgi:gliding motility-associated-like protein